MPFLMQRVGIVSFGDMPSALEAQRKLRGFTTDMPPYNFVRCTAIPPFTHCNYYQVLSTGRRFKVTSSACGSNRELKSVSVPN